MEKDTSKEIISVIIPVYNVQDYLNQCLESVCNQTYTQLEIILVDDGSTDNSGAICDEWAKKDARIVVIHKTNGGLSDARNEGMKIAKGDYIGFVDSDDWIELNMYERMHSLCEENGLELLIARFYEEYQEEVCKRDNSYSGKFNLMSGELLNEVFAMGHSDYVISPSVWDRLYKRTVLEGIYFPVGKRYEDICYSTEVFLRVNRAGYLDVPMYHYRIRSDSIMGMRRQSTNDVDLDTLADLLSQMKHRADIYYKAGYKKYGDKALFAYFYKVLCALTCLYKKGRTNVEYRKLRKEFYGNSALIKDYIRRTKSVKEKWILGLSCFHVETYIRFIMLKRRLQ